MDTIEQQQPATEEEQPEYAMVEVFGHRSHVGRVLEVERFGTKMLRIDVPIKGDFINGYTSHFYGGASIFSLTPCDLATVAKANKPRELPALYRSSHDDDDENEYGE